MGHSLKPLCIEKNTVV